MVKEALGFLLMIVPSNDQNRDIVCLPGTTCVPIILVQSGHSSKWQENQNHEQSRHPSILFLLFSKQTIDFSNLSLEHLLTLLIPNPHPPRFAHHTPNPNCNMNPSARTQHEHKRTYTT